MAMITIQKINSTTYLINRKEVRVYGSVIKSDDLDHQEKQALENFVKAEQNGIKIQSTIRNYESRG